MSHSIQQFQFHTFTLETIEKEGQPWFIASPLADFLGYQNPAEAIRTNVDEEDIAKIYIPTKSNNYTCVNESGLYSLIIRSNKPEAKTFKRWLTHEVLPSIRKHGYYVHPNAGIDKDSLDQVTGNKPFQRLNTAKFSELRKISREMAQAYLLECGITPDYVKSQIGLAGDYAASNIYGGNSKVHVASLVAAFVKDWQDGTLGAPFIHCQSQQAVRLFAIYTQRVGVSWYHGDNTFLEALGDVPELYKKRVRISKGKYANPRSIIMVHGLQTPSGYDFTDYLADCINQMDAALANFI